MSTEPTDDLVLHTLPLSGDAGDAFVALAAVLGTALMSGGAFDPLSREAFALASRLVARARGAAGAPTDAELRIAAVEHAEGAGAAAEEMGIELAESLDQLSEELVQLTEELLREVALEEHTHDAYLALEGDTDNLLLVVVPVSAATAHVRLLSFLFDRVESTLLDEPLDELERAACAWWFRRWTPARAGEEEELAMDVREQEWSLLERPTLAAGMSFMEYAVGEEEMLEALPPRQAHLARQLLESVPGIWQVRERAGEDALFVSLVDGSEHPVREHADEAEYGAGTVAIGRLIPFGDGSWLRSPGMMLVAEPTEEWTRALTSNLMEAQQMEVSPSIMLEAAITRTATGERVPRAIPPARSAGEARELLQAVPPLLVEAGIARPLDAKTLAPEVRASLPAGALYDYELDEVLTDWMQALDAMSRKGTGGNKSKSGKRKRR